MPRFSEGRVTSGSGMMSEWSDTAYVTVADPITCTITATSLDTVTVTSTDEEGDPVPYTVDGLTEMPLTVTVTGAGDAGTTSVIIERASAYHVERPDESSYDGHEGETVFASTMTGEGTFTIDTDDLIGSLDDGAAYTIIATVQDSLGQEASDRIGRLA